MSEFEKELDGILEIIKDEKFYNSKLYALPSIEELKAHFKDWQPPKPLVEVPQYVADLIKVTTTKGFKPLINSAKLGELGFTEEKLQEILYWINEHQEEYMRAWLDGYTVKKEKLFYLKNKNTGHILYRQPKEAGGNLIEVVATINEEYTWFTQDEIDTMHTGSYEQIEVEP